MKIEDVMSTDVVSVGPETPLKFVAEQLVDRKISGMPVVDDGGNVVGVISEADLLVKEQGAAGTRRGTLTRRFGRGHAGEHAKREARVAGDAMTSPAITIEPFRPVAAAAREMLERGINRLPVVRNHLLVGIVSRADLMRAFARSDEQVADEIRHQVAYFLALEDEAATVDVRVDAGEVTLDGKVRRRLAAETLPGFVASVPGVVGVRSELTWTENGSERD
jgi:CBS domain-containing protein